MNFISNICCNYFSHNIFFNYFCAMTKHLNPLEAWANFWEYIRQPEAWANLERKERQYLYKTGAQLKAGEVGPRRLVVIFERHRPGYYKLTETFEIDE